MKRSLLACALLAPALTVGDAAAQAPPGYYASVDSTSPAALRATLHAVIDDHTRLPYTAGSVDTWDVLNLAQENPANSSQILDVYRNFPYAKGDTSYNREHTWPKSYGFPDDGPDNYPYTDCHMLHLCDGSYNTARSNRPFRECSASCSEYPTQGGGAGTYPGNSCWGSGSFSNGTWEVWGGRRGDIARALLYADVRYEGGVHGVTGSSEPDLVLTDSQALIDSGNTGSNESLAYMGELSVLLQWHLDDPVDDFERNRNDVVFAFQGNRNPFVDHPEWVDCLFNGNCANSGPIGSAVCSPGQPNSTGVGAQVGAFGNVLVALDDLTLTASNLPANQFGYFLCSATPATVPFPGGSQGVLCLGGQIGRFVAQVQNSGSLGTMGIPVDTGALPLTPVQAIQPGETWRFQCWYRDLNPGPTSNFTDAVQITFQ